MLSIPSPGAGEYRPPPLTSSSRSVPCPEARATMADGEEQEEAQPEPVPPLTEEEFESRKVVYDAVFEGQAADNLKVKARAERMAEESPLANVKGLTYSEVSMEIVNMLLNKIKESGKNLYAGKGLFLDLGSGAGKACIAAGLAHPFEKVVGVEVVNCLSDAATAAYTTLGEAVLPDGCMKPEVEFVKGDFAAEFDSKVEPIAPQVEVCLVNATCFEEEQMQAVEKLAKLMPHESIIITISKKLPESLIIDENRSPKQRRAQAVKKALAVRGVEPDSIEIVVEPPVNDPKGFYLVHSEQVHFTLPPERTATCFIFKKAPAPPEAEEAAPPAEGE